MPELEVEAVSDPKFKVGDIVRHRASFNTGVVVQVVERCTNPSHVMFHLDGKCSLQFKGDYALSTDWDTTVVAEECILEAKEPG